jgi:colanic acid/amylovoran biosynthesis glycosyltransferase
MELLNVGHFIVTYTGTSWLSAQLQKNERVSSTVYSWTRVTEDDVTRGTQYRQLFPHLGYSMLARRAALGLASAEYRIGRTTRRFSAALQRDGIQALHTHFGRAGYYALGAVQQTKLPLITSFYGYDVSEYPTQYPIWRRHYQHLFAQAHTVLCLGRQMQQNIIALGCPPEKTRIHHLGVDVAAIRFQPRRWEPGSPLRVLIAAAFRQRKGIPYALEALAAFRDAYPVEITIIGDAPDHPDGRREKQIILDTLQRHRLQPIVRLLGNQPYPMLFAEAARHHLFMGPSITADDGDMEGTPMVLADMAASGIPIIATTHSDIPEIVIHGQTGLLAAERDAEALLQHLRWYATHTEAWDAMLHAGRQHIEAEFDRTRQNARLADLYTQAAASA